MTFLVSKLPRCGAPYPSVVLSLTSLLRQGTHFYSLNLWNTSLPIPPHHFYQHHGELAPSLLSYNNDSSMAFFPSIHFSPWVPWAHCHPRWFFLKRCVTHTIPKMLCEYLTFYVGTHILRLAIETFYNHFHPMCPTFSLSRRAFPDRVYTAHFLSKTFLIVSSSFQMPHCFPSTDLWPIHSPSPCENSLSFRRDLWMKWLDARFCFIYLFF